MRGIRLIVVSFLLVLFSTPAWAADFDLFDLRSEDRVTVANYNVENLFDTVHQDGKDDYTYLPKKYKDSHPDLMRQVCEPLSNPWYKKECYELDWSEEVLAQKLHNIGQSIRAMNDGRGPDILVLEEVKNTNVLQMLRDQALSDLGYQSIVLIPGPDKRGINVAMLSRFPVVDAQLHLVDLDNPVPRPSAVSLEEAMTMEWNTPSFMIQDTNSKRVTRGILEATFKIGDHLLTVFGNHWPSQAAPTEFRARAAWTLYQAASAAFDRKREVIALGDFNVVDNETPNPVAQYLLNGSHPLQFLDAREEFLHRFGHDRIAPGTHFYDNHWNSLDKLLVLKQSFGNKEDNEWAKFHVHAPDFVLEDLRTRSGAHPSFGGLLEMGNFPAGKMPMRFNPQTRTGYSDHLGIVGEIQL